MAKCSVGECNRKEVKDGFCSTHLPKGKSAGAKVCTVALGRLKGMVAANASFAALADSDTQAAPYKRRIEHLRSSGPTLGQPELVHGIQCLHDTQPSNNKTVWYTWQGDTITIWGLGGHVGKGNSSYDMLWCDGTNKTWKRPKGG